MTLIVAREKERDFRADLCADPLRSDSTCGSIADAGLTIFSRSLGIAGSVVSIAARIIASVTFSPARRNAGRLPLS